MATDWFYIRGGQQTGPVPFEELRGMAERGEIGAHDLVWSDGMADWQPAHSVHGLLPADAAVTPGPGGPSGPGAPPGPGGYAAAPGSRRVQPAKTGIPGLVITGFILSFIPICMGSIIGIVLCAVGLPEAKRRGAGVGMAIAGIVIGIVVFILFVAIYIAVIIESGGFRRY